MFILWWSVSLIKQTNKQTSITKAHFSVLLKNPLWVRSEWPSKQFRNEVMALRFHSFGWSKERSWEKRVSKSVLFIPSPLAAFCSFQHQECEGWCSAAGMYRSTCKPIVLNETWKPGRTRALLLVVLFISATKRDSREAWNITQFL